MYYILSNELQKPKFDAKIEGALLDSKGQLIPSAFGRGNSLRPAENNQYFIRINENFSRIGKLRDRLIVHIYHHQHLLVVSERMQDMLHKMAFDQVELYPLTIDFNANIISNYKIVNIVNKIDCVNYEKSELDFEFYDKNNVGEGSIYTIDSLVLDESLIPPNLNIFLLGRHEDSIIIVHERLKEMICSHGFSGFIFCKPEEFQL
ncbi:MAG: hypothetical protein QM802_03455 [Agriterribacter sp.]